MELTPGILKAVESSFMQNYNIGLSAYVVRYKGRLMSENNKLTTFSSRGNAHIFVVAFVKNIFHQGEYWQEYKENTKVITSYDVDYSATIKILPQYGLTSRFDLPENKKMFEDITTQLLEAGIISIEKLNI